MNHSTSSKRIVKNTLFMYSRTLVIMFISLYTSRIVLQNLGVTDYGIYNIVAGFVTMFSIISSTLTSSTQRFITFEMGKGLSGNLQGVFSSSLAIQYLLAFGLLVLLETVGLWFLNNKLNIPQERLFAANFVFQFSIAAFIVNIISIPYNALIIANEKMNVLAFVGMLEAGFKVLIAVGISLYNRDKLILYGALTLVSSLTVRIIYQYYCRRSNKALDFSVKWNPHLIKTMFGFAGWNFIGSASGILKDQGISVVLNILFGVTLNAARGIVVQIETVVNQFVSGFTTSFNPQITKSYASKDFDYMYKLVYNGGRFAFFLMLVIAFPIILNTETILNLWLVEVPAYTVIFVKLSLIYYLILTVSYPLITLNMAVGRIRNYQLIVGGAHFLNFPLSYIFLKWGFEPFIVYVLAIFLNIVCLFLRLVILKENIGLSILRYSKEVLLNILLVVIVCIPIPIWLKFILPANFWTEITLFFLTFFISVITVFSVGLKSEERKFMINMIRTKIKI